MDKHSLSDFSSDNISDSQISSFTEHETAEENSKKNKQPEVLQKKNKDFTDKFDIPIKDDGKKESKIPDDEDEFISPTKAKNISTSDKPTQIIKNPKDNIRYMKKRETVAEQKRRIKSEFLLKNKLKKDETISAENTENISDENSDNQNFHETSIKTNTVLSKYNDIISDIKLKKEQRKKRKRGSHRLQIEIKSTPDIDFFSMTFDELANNPVEPIYVSDDIKAENEKSSADNAPEIKSHIEDYDKPEDADSVLSDMYDLKSTLHSRIITLAVLAVLCAYISLADTNNFPIFNALQSSVSPHGFIFIQLIMGIVALAASFTVVIGGIKKLFKRSADCDTMASAAMLSSLVAGIVSFINTDLIEKGLIHIYMPVGIFALLFNALGKYLIVGRAIQNFGFVSDNSIKKYAMFCIDDEDRAEKITRGYIDDYPVVAASRKTDFLTDFLKYTYSTDIADKFCKYAVPAFSVISFLAALLIPLVNISKYSGGILPACFSVFAMCMALCSCFAVPIIVNLPMYSIAKEYANTSGLMLGYQSVEDFYDANAVMADAKKLFPENSVILAGIKMFSDTKIDDALLDAGSLAVHAGSILSDMFIKIADGKKEIFRKVESYVYEDLNGICGWIDNRRVLLGSRELMSGHSIEGLPLESTEHEYTKNGHKVVYLSISGNLSAMFILQVKANPEIKYWLSEMAEYNIKLMVKSNDSLVSSESLSALFEIPQEYFKIVGSDCHEDFEIETNSAPKTSASMAYEGDLSTMIKLITDSRNLRRNFVVGILMQCAAAILGIILAVVFICMDSVQEVNPTMILAYNLIWTIIISALAKARIF